jgi:hypothetical protein
VVRGGVEHFTVSHDDLGSSGDQLSLAVSALIFFYFEGDLRILELRWL